MSQRTVKGSAELGNKIRQRRNELGLTIEEAAAKAGVGVKTWCRYEAGESIRQDKYLRVCSILNWNNSYQKSDDEEEVLDIEKIRKEGVWSSFLEENLGEQAALSFAIGSDILLDHLKMDLEELSLKPRGTHVGELNISWIAADLPSQFLMKYDYNFLYRLKSVVVQYRNTAKRGERIIAHSVLEELTLYLIMEESSLLMETFSFGEKNEDAVSWNEWVFDLFDDMDIIIFLYSDSYLDEQNPYHFDHWLEKQFYCDQER